VPLIHELCAGNPQYYLYSPASPEPGHILKDLRLTPPGVPLSRKHYVGLFDGERLIAVMDVVDSYPDEDTAFIGFFMLARERQGRGVGSVIIADTLERLKAWGFTAVRLCIDEGNPQSTAFWQKNGFAVIERFPRENGALLLAQRKLSPEESERNS
jgi:GNAT superfamily N-acetyltransferase